MIKNGLRFTLVAALTLSAVAGGARAAEWSYTPGVDAVVRMTGLITRGDANRLSRLLQQHGVPVGARFHLESRGGDVDESMVVGRMLRKHQAVITHGYCASSCVFEFVGGAKRYMAKNASGIMSVGLAVHQPSATAALIRSPNKAIQAKFQVLNDYLTEMTGSQNFYTVMVNIPFESPVALSTNDAYSMGVIDGVY